MEAGREPKKPDRVSRVIAFPALRRMRVNAERLPTSGYSTRGPGSSPSGAGRGAGGSATSRPTRRRNLDRAGNARTWFPLLRRVARSPDQCAGPIVRHGFACTQYRHTNTKFGADAGRELLRKHAGERVGIKTRAPVDSYRQVFGRHGKRNLRQ